jgi:flagellar hook-associated protein 3 FlgL
MNAQMIKISREIASGRKIEYGYQGVREFSNTLLLDYEETELTQVIDTSNKALQTSKNSDDTISGIQSALETFKTKLIYAANNEHSTQSYKAIAEELKGLRDHIISLSNTSVDGKFIFSGTKTNQIPIDADGKYSGNSGEMRTIIGSHHRVQFNIPGSDLFFGNNQEIQKQITTNVQRFNQTKLHPYTMSDINKRALPEEVHITEKDKIRDLVGDNDDDDTNDPLTVFYIKGTNKAGETFKERVALSSNEDITTLLTKIENLYDFNVDATINKYGILELKDKQSGSSLLDFHIVGATDFNAGAGATGTALQNDIDDVSFANLHITEFLRSEFRNENRGPTISAVKEAAGVGEFNINTSFITDSNTAAEANELLTNMFPAGTNQIQFTGQTVQNTKSVPPTTTTAVNTVFNITATSTIGDLMNFVKNNYDDDANPATTNESINVYLDNGKIKIEDRTIVDKVLDVSTFSLTMTGQTAAGVATNTFSVLDSILKDRFYFTADGSNITSNTPQISKVTNEYATGSTLVQDVAGVDINNRQLVVNFTDVNGAAQTLTIDFTDTVAANGVMSTFTVGGNTYPIFQEDWDNVLEDRNLVLTTAENTLATTAGFNASDNDKLVVDSANFAGLVVNDYIEIDGQYKQVIAINNATVAGKSLITVDSNYTYIPPNQPAGVSLPLDYEKVRWVKPEFTNTDNFSYRQLQDIVAMATSNNLPSVAAIDRFPEWNRAVENASEAVAVELDREGKLTLRDNNNSPTRIELEMHTALSENFDPTNANAVKEPFLSFQSNNAITIDEPKITLFDVLNSAIESTTRGISRQDAFNGFDPRDRSIQSYIEQLDHLASHVGTQQTKAGTQSQSLSFTIERSELLIVETRRIKENVLNLDVASAYSRFQSLQISYQAILAQISKVQNLTLVNYYN